MYAMPPYPYLATDYGTMLSLFTHHMWIGGFCVVGAGAHAAIFMVRDYDPTNNYNNLLDRVIRHRDAIISHLNWVCIFLGFHSFGLYIHNDTMSALGRPQDMFSDTAIQLQPVFAQWIQNTHFLAPQFTAPNALAATSATWGGDFVAVGGKVAMMPISLGTSDFMVRFVVDHVKLRYMLEQLVLCLSPIVNVFQVKTLGIRQNLKAKANQQETNNVLGSSETTREASFDFSDYYKNLPQHLNVNQCSKKFLAWFIGFVEADGHYSSRLTNSKMDFFENDPRKLLCIIQVKEKKIQFEITQKDAKLLFKIRKELGYGRVYPVTKPNGKIYYRYFTSKKEHILRLITLFNGNLVLKKRQHQFEHLISKIKIIWNINISVKTWNVKPTLTDTWLSGFVEGDGAFYTNQGNCFIRGKYPDGRIRYGFFLKFYITQKGEKDILIHIRDLFQATNQILTFRKKNSLTTYYRIEICNTKSRDLIINYFEKFPLLGDKNIWFKRWKRIHGYQQRGERLTQKSAQKLQKLLMKLEENETTNIENLF